VLFEQRELKDFAEAIDSSKLREGRTYFAVRFLDNELLIPEVEALVYIGRNLEPEDVAKFYFQDAESFRQGVPYTDSGDKAVVYGQDERHLKYIFEFEQALELLMTCSLRRRRRGV